jgi:hypothetical protein
VGKQPRCKDCCAGETKEWYSKNKDKSKDWSLRNNYGITLADFDRMLADQNNSCKICETSFDKPELGIGDRPCVDHDHKTGKIRGILCNACNRGIGYLKDSVRIIENAKDYLCRT